MMQLDRMIQGIRVKKLKGNSFAEVVSLQIDSRQTRPGSLFTAIRGTDNDGHNFIRKAEEMGASVIVCEHFPDAVQDEVTYLEVDDSAEALGHIASAFYGNPSAELSLVGITGTNGKTTTATLLYRLFEDIGTKAGLISTIRNRIHDETAEATHTTPDAIHLNELLRRMVDAGCTHCFMEVSSHAADQRRIAGLNFAGGVFTNISHDHLDYHKSFGRYIEAKQEFFKRLHSGSFALVNKDDKHGMVMLQNCSAKKYTYALATMSDFRCKVVENTAGGLHLSIDGQDVWFRLIGRFNAYNLLAVYGTARLLGEEKISVLKALSRLNPVEGRFNYLKSPGRITAIVDYAHSPDALKNVLETINDIREGKGALITVVGAGGNRDTAKRPLMATIASEMSDRVILTSDNPRFEDPEKILEEMRNGVAGEYEESLHVIPDRREAIRAAIAMAKPGDYILVAGKGHERYQEIKGIRYPFDDMETVRELFRMTKTELKL